MMHLLNFVLLALAAGNALAAPIEDQAGSGAVDTAATAASRIARHAGVMPTFRPLSADGSFTDKRSPQLRANHGLPLPIVGVHPSPGSNPVAPWVGPDGAPVDGHIGRKPAERQGRSDHTDTTSLEARDDIPDARPPRIGGVSAPPGVNGPAPKHSGESSHPDLPPGIHGPAPKHSGDPGSSTPQIPPGFTRPGHTPVGRSDGSDETTYPDQ